MKRITLYTAGMGQANFAGFGMKNNRKNRAGKIMCLPAVQQKAVQYRQETLLLSSAYLAAYVHAQQQNSRKTTTIDFFHFLLHT
jgi:hypothetical protein